MTVPGRLSDERRRALQAQNSGDELQFVLFRVGGIQYAVSIFQVDRILPDEPARPAARELPGLLGWLPFEGGRVPLVDLRRRAGVPEAHGEETRIMVLLPDRSRLAVVVDQVSRVIRADIRTIVPAPEGETGPFGAGLSGTLPRPEQAIKVINPTRLFGRDERQAFLEAVT